ncbi:helix-turn-helix domain-containing protein [Mycobacteroides franklinii]
MGRPAAMSAGQVEQAKTLVGAGHRVGDVARTLGVGRSTLYRVLGEAS